MLLSWQNEKTQILTTFLWLRLVSNIELYTGTAYWTYRCVDILIDLHFQQYWHHEFLMWDPEECDGLTKISLPVKNLWSPDIIVYEL